MMEKVGSEWCDKGVGCEEVVRIVVGEEVSDGVVLKIGVVWFEVVRLAGD